MGTKIKGFYKGFKFISQIFVVKDSHREMEIGLPTDVKHVAHIGWDGQSASGPSWMNEFKSATGTNNSTGVPGSTCTSRDHDQRICRQISCGVFNDSQSNLPKALKKHKRKKSKSTTSSPRHSGSSSSRTSNIKV